MNQKAWNIHLQVIFDFFFFFYHGCAFKMDLIMRWNDQALLKPQIKSTFSI